MASPQRVQLPGYYHIITRATGGGDYFIDDDDRRLFRTLFLQTARELEWRIHAYCLMRTHYHAVIEIGHPNLSHGMQRINSTYALRFNKRWSRFGALVAARFKSHAIEDDRYFAAVCRYVLMNPVSAELCERPSEWPWSGGLVARDMSYSDDL